MLFKVERNKRFASYLTIYNKALKLKASAVAEHLSPRIIISEQCNFLFKFRNYLFRRTELRCERKGRNSLQRKRYENHWLRVFINFY